MGSRGIMAAVMAATLASSAALADDPGEKALRCSVPGDAPLFMRSEGAIGQIAVGKTSVVHAGQPLPKVMVDGWTPSPGPLGALLSDLGSEAGFKVSGADGLGQVSWSGSPAPLTSVVESLTSQVGASWSYAAGTLVVAKGPPATVVEASMPLPASRDASLTLLDTLRGLDARHVEIHGVSITFSASPEVLSRIRTTVSGISQIYAFDVAFLEAQPKGGAFDWKAAGGVSFGPSHVVFGDDAESHISNLLKSAGEPRPDGAQTVSGPAGWALVVPEGQCGTGSSEIVLKPKRTGDGFMLQIQGGGFSESVPMVGIGQTLVVAGSQDAGWTRMITIRPRVVAVK